MSNNSQLNKLGEQMKGALNDALTTGNYDNLKSIVSDTVTSALNEAGVMSSKAWQQKEEWRQQEIREQEERRRKREARKQEELRSQREENNQEKWKREDINQEEWRRQREKLHQEEWKRQQELRERQMKAAQAHREAQQRQNNALVQQRMQNTALMVDVKNKGMVAGVLFVVFGSIANVPFFIFSLLGVLFGWDVTGVLLFLLLVSILIILIGKKKLQLIEKAKRYVKLCGVKMYAEVEELASQVGLKPKKVEKELRKILQKGIIPSAHMDKKGTHLMLNEVVYKQYTDAEKARLLREKEEKEQGKRKVKVPEEPVTEEKQEPKTELEQMIAEGQEYIVKLRHLNDLIPGEGISSKLYRLEKLLQEIFTRLEKEPAQMNRMHKVMNYYLPTTLKLVEAYHEFDIISSPNEEILSAKSEIEATLDTINEAFVELLNSLFQDKVFDITTDAQVLQTMLANEGLTKEMDVTKVDN